MTYQPIINGKECGKPITWDKMYNMRCCIKGIKFRQVWREAR